MEIWMIFMEIMDDSRLQLNMTLGESLTNRKLDFQTQ